MKPLSGVQISLKDKLAGRSPCSLILHMKISDSSLVDEIGYKEAEDTTDSQVFPVPAKILLQIFPGRPPLFNVFILFHLHSACHGYESGIEQRYNSENACLRLPKSLEMPMLVLRFNALSENPSFSGGRFTP